MTDLIYERDYAREMLVAAIRQQTDPGPLAEADSDSAKGINVLIDQALEAGCSRNQLIVELAVLAGRLFVQSDSQPDHVAC
jgi:hypothetical protein